MKCVAGVNVISISFNINELKNVEQMINFIAFWLKKLLIKMKIV